jgi:hypothetical protein
MGTELVPETLYSNELTRLCAREDYIESCRRESFKTYRLNLIWFHLKINLKPTVQKIFICLLHIPLGQQIDFQ